MLSCGTKNALILKALMEQWTEAGDGMWTEEGQAWIDRVRDEGDEKVRGKCSWVSGGDVRIGGFGMTLSLLGEREEVFFLKKKKRRY